MSVITTNISLNIPYLLWQLQEGPRKSYCFRRKEQLAVLELFEGWGDSLLPAAAFRLVVLKQRVPYKGIVQ